MITIISLTTPTHINLGIRHSVKNNIYSLFFPPLSDMECEFCIKHDSLKLMYWVQKIESARFIAYIMSYIEHIVYVLILYQSSS